jgi:hypothetical protein
MVNVSSTLFGAIAVFVYRLLCGGNATAFGWRENLGLAAFWRLPLCVMFPWLYCLLAWGFWQLYQPSADRHYRLFHRDSRRAVLPRLHLLLPGTVIVGLWFSGSFVGEALAWALTQSIKITKFSNSFGAVHNGTLLICM